MGKKPRIKAKQNKAKDVERKPPPAIAMPPRRQLSNIQVLGFLDYCVEKSPISRGAHVHAQQALRQISAALGELDRLKAASKNPN